MLCPYGRDPKSALDVEPKREAGSIALGERDMGWGWVQQEAIVGVHDARGRVDTNGSGESVDEPSSEVSDPRVFGTKLRP